MTTETSPRVGDLDALVRRASERAGRTARPILVSLTRRVAPRDPLDLFAALPGSERALWLRPASGESLVGAGAAHAFVGPGPEQVAHAWQALVRDAVVEDPDHLAWTGPLLLGGFVFDPLRPPSPHWAGFPPARLVLPSTLYVQRDGQAWQTTNVVVCPDAPALRPVDSPGALGQARASTAGAMRASALSASPPNDPLANSAERWQALVDSTIRGIRDGSLGVEKVVLAREAHVRVTTQPEACLRRLAREYPTCTVFALDHDGGCFLGATPERLAHAEHGTAWTMALAGSIARGATPAEDERLARQLLASPKERAEHAVVVRAVREALSDPELCTNLSAEDDEPRLARLPNVQHLLTPIRAQLAPAKTLLDLVARLHPSPAVAGFPQAQALSIVRDGEGFDRGWYGGPLGWLNAAGDGEFVVAIRAGLLRGQNAWLYAGCGIVADSEPAAEYAESELKLRPMRSALGLSPA